MALSKEEESYKHFTSLREKFSKPAVTKQEVQKQDKPRTATGRSRRGNHDPRANAPPLMPLVEEGDQIQQGLHTSSVDERLKKLSGSKLSTATPVKGKWKHSTQYKANHLNGPDFDPLETASVTSGSSAYSSRSESSAFSPFGAGSVTELSDVGSSDTFLEYDHHPHRCTSEGKGVELVKGVTHPRHPSEGKGVALTEDVTPDMVPKTTKAWNRAIGDWVFRGVVQESATPQPAMRKPSNEVRIPTPLSTPLSSTCNLLDSGSGISLLNSIPDSDSGEQDSLQYSPTGEQDSLPTGEQDAPRYSPAHYKMGSFLRPESNFTTCGTDDHSSTEITMTTEPEPENTVAPPTNKWQQAFAKFQELNKSAQSKTTPQRKSAESAVKESAESTVKESWGSVVASRAEKFGGAKKRGLRRAQSFQFGSRPPSQLTTHKLNTSSDY